MPINVRFRECDGAIGADVMLRVVPGPVPVHEPLHEWTVYAGLRPLAGAAVAEEWLSSTPVARGRDRIFHYAHNDEICFGWLYFKASDSVELAARAAYANAFRVFKKLGFAHLLKVWHYLPDIHAQEQGASRYARFCRGRFTAFAAAGGPNYCAATVIGTRAPFGVMYFLAANEAGAAVENPRQTSAWRYPLPAVEERPLFARAVCKTWGKRVHFYGSGTAGIVGHESRHPGDAAAQLREALLNLRALLDASPGFGGVERLTCLKAYLKRADDAAAVRKVLAASPFAADLVALFEGEICRAELCVEIEALIV